MGLEIVSCSFTWYIEYFGFVAWTNKLWGWKLCSAALPGRLNILVLWPEQINCGAGNCVLQLYLVY